MNITIDIRVVDPRGAEFLKFLQASDDYAASLYPAESNHMLDVATLLKPQMNFYGAFVNDVPKGCGGFWEHEDYIEIKRVWIDPAARGLGLAKKIMIVLEAAAEAKGFAVARLETGISQPEALSLYRAIGYVDRSPFGDYRPDPLSVFMEKQL